MIRKTAFGLIAAAATLAAALGASASTASAGTKVHIGFGGFGYGFGHHGYGYGYHAPYYGYHHCKRVFVGYHKVWTHYGWVKEPTFKKVCY